MRPVYSRGSRRGARCYPEQVLKRGQFPLSPCPAPPADRPPGARSPDPGGRYLSWAELLRRVFALDALRCPRCSSRMKILAQIHPPDTTRAILDCLGLASRAPPCARVRAEPDSLPFPAHALRQRCRTRCRREFSHSAYCAGAIVAGRGLWP